MHGLPTKHGLDRAAYPTKAGCKSIPKRSSVLRALLNHLAATLMQFLLLLLMISRYGHVFLRRILVIRKDSLSLSLS